MEHAGRVTSAGLAALGLVILAACGSASATAAGAPPRSPSASAATPKPCTKGTAFALSLSSDRGGQASPVAAAIRFGRHGGVAGVHPHGWRMTSRGTREATVTSGSLVLHALQGPDGTWQIDSGYHCS